MSLASEIRAWAVASAAAFALVAVGYRVLTFPGLPDISATVQKANATLDTINRPCGGGRPCGTLANVDKLLVKSGDIIVTTQMQVKETNRIVNAAADSLTLTSEHLNAQIDRVGPLLDSARGATDVLPGAITSASADIHGVAVGAAGAVDEARQFIAQPALSGTIQNVEVITGNAAAMTDDAKRVADKATADYLRPVPWYLWPVKRVGQLWDVGAAVARHTP